MSLNYISTIGLWFSYCMNNRYGWCTRKASILSIRVLSYINQKRRWSSLKLTKKDGVSIRRLWSILQNGEVLVWWVFGLPWQSRPLHVWCGVNIGISSSSSLGLICQLWSLPIYVWYVMRFGYPDVCLTKVLIFVLY